MPVFACGQPQTPPNIQHLALVEARCPASAYSFGVHHLIPPDHTQAYRSQWWHHCGFQNGASPHRQYPLFGAYRAFQLFLPNTPTDAPGCPRDGGALTFFLAKSGTVLQHPSAFVGVRQHEGCEPIRMHRGPWPPGVSGHPPSNRPSKPPTQPVGGFTITPRAELRSAIKKSVGICICEYAYDRPRRRRPF